MFGYADLRNLYEQLGRFGRSPGDEDVDQETFERRFNFQVEKLVDVGVPRDVAEQVIDIVRPTGGSTQAHFREPDIRGNDPVDPRDRGFR